MTQKQYKYDGKWSDELDKSLDSSKTLVLFFGSSKKEHVQKALQEIQETYKNSIIVGASTAGEIYMDELEEESAVVSVVKFETTQVRLTTELINDTKDSFHIGERIATTLTRNDLKSIFVLSDGLNINGSQLTSGLNSVLDSATVVSGGLAGDGANFESTWVIVNGEMKSHYVSALGFYGNTIEVESGYRGGWDKFGIQRKVTRATDNILYELDNKPALDIYKMYLGDKAKDLPSSGLLFPLELEINEVNKSKTVRTILAVDEDKKSITFAGDIPEGSFVSLMKANHDRLIEGAFDASRSVNLKNHKDEEVLCIAISCIGRKLVLKQKVEDELEATLENLPDNTKQIGFYSYGEISPGDSGKCNLHNQTMTLTVIWEKDASST